MSEQPVRVVVTDDLERNRLTVLFRLILVIPHGIWLALWGIAALVAAIANWFATLARGRSPQGLHRFLALYVRYATQVYAYLYLAADPYPSFDGRAGYPVEVEIAPPLRQPRVGVALRLLIAIPALLIGGALLGEPTLGQSRSSTRSSTYFFEQGGMLHVAAFLGWFAILARGRMPRGLRDTAVWAVGFGAQLWAYLFLLTSRYPDPDPAVSLGELPVRDDPVALHGEDDLRRSRLTVLFRLLLAVPHLVWLTLWGILVVLAAVASWFATLIAGRTPAPLHSFLSAFVRYQAHVYAFLYLLANPFPGFSGAPGAYPVEARIAPRASQRRWTVALRILLAIPALLLSSAYNTVFSTAAFLGWFYALVRGRMPRSLVRAQAQALRFGAQTSAYLLLLTDDYPYGGPCVAQDSA